MGTGEGAVVLAQVGEACAGLTRLMTMEMGHVDAFKRAQSAAPSVEDDERTRGIKNNLSPPLEYTSGWKACW